MHTCTALGLAATNRRAHQSVCLWIQSPRGHALRCTAAMGGTPHGKHEQDRRAHAARARLNTSKPSPHVKNQARQASKHAAAAGRSQALARGLCARRRQDVQGHLLQRRLLLLWIARGFTWGFVGCMESVFVGCTHARAMPHTLGFGAPATCIHRPCAARARAHARTRANAHACVCTTTVRSSSVRSSTCHGPARVRGAVARAQEEGGERAEFRISRAARWHTRACKRFDTAHAYAHARAHTHTHTHTHTRAHAHAARTRVAPEEHARRRRRLEVVDVERRRDRRQQLLGEARELWVEERL